MDKKISNNTFKKLTQHEQYDLVFTRGNFVDYYLKGETRFALYSIFKFFVEVEYNVPKNKIINLITFEDGKLLERYWILTDLK